MKSDSPERLSSRSLLTNTFTRYVRYVPAGFRYQMRKLTQEPSLFLVFVYILLQTAFFASMCYLTAHRAT